MIFQIGTGYIDWLYLAIIFWHIEQDVCDCINHFLHLYKLFKIINNAICHQYVTYVFDTHIEPEMSKRSHQLMLEQYLEKYDSTYLSMVC